MIYLIGCLELGNFHFVEIKRHSEKKKNIKEKIIHEDHQLTMNFQ